MTPVQLELPQAPRDFKTLVLDFTGTLSLDGDLIPGVAEALRDLSSRLRILVLTADTFGTARRALEGLPVEIRIIRNGEEKARLVAELGGSETIAVGNGRNDVLMMDVAGLGVAVLGPEGAAASLLSAADVVARDILDALALLTNPLRLRATLRD